MPSYDPLLRWILESPRGMIIFALDRTYRYLFFTQEHALIMQQLWGATIEVGGSMLEYIHDPDDRQKAQCHFDTAMEGEHLLLHEQYARVYWEDCYAPLRNDEGEIVGVSVFVRDLSQYMALQEELIQEQVKTRILQERAMILQSIGEGVYGIDRSGKAFFVNPAALEMLGYTEEAFLGHDPHALIYPSMDLEGSQESRDLHHINETRIKTRGWLYRYDGTPMPVRFIATPIFLEGILSGRVIAFSDITSELEAEEQLKALNTQLNLQAISDPLTHMYNRRYFDRYTQGLCEHTSPWVLILFDLDHFKRVNDTYGHDIGDRVLITLSNVAKNSLRQSDLLARIGGEEFAIVLPNTSLDEGIIIAQRIHTLISSTQIQTPQGIIHCTASMGVSAWDESLGSVSALLRQSDQKLYQAKAQGRNCIIS